MFTYCYVLAQIKNLKLPFGVMFFGKADQVVDQGDIARFGGDMTVVASEHLMDCAGDDPQVGLGQTVFERYKGQVEAALVVGEVPGVHVITGDVVEFDFIKFMDAVVQDEGVLGGGGKIPEAESQVETNRAAIGQEAGSAGPVPEGLVFPDAAPPVERAQAFV